MKGSIIDPQIKSTHIGYQDQEFKTNDTPHKSSHVSGVNKQKIKSEKLQGKEYCSIVLKKKRVIIMIEKALPVRTSTNCVHECDSGRKCSLQKFSLQNWQTIGRKSRSLQAALNFQH